MSLQPYLVLNRLPVFSMFVTDKLYRGFAYMSSFENDVRIGGDAPTDIHYKYYGPSNSGAIDPSIPTLV